MDRKKKISLALGVQLLSLFCCADGFGADKSRYSLFHPTPREEMRPFSIDPSPYAVDAGHVVVEAGLISYERHTGKNEDGEKIISESATYGQLNLRVGIINELELLLAFPSYVSHQVRQGAQEETASGFGNTSIGIKVNLFGNDEGSVALALTPSLKFPTAKGDLGNPYVEPGMGATLGLALPADFSLTIVPEWHRRRGDQGAVFSELEVVTNLGYALSDETSLYGEFVSGHSTAPGARWSASAGGGATFLLNPDLAIDLGSNFGLTDAAPDISPFISLSIRY